MTKLVMTVSYVIDGDKIILGLKQNRLGEGLYNGFGGRVKEDETYEQAAIRELEEESGLKALNIKKFGEIQVTYESGHDDVELHFYLVNEFTGKPVESDEMIPEDFSLSEIPYDQMWPSDGHILPIFLAGTKCSGYFHLSDPKKRELIDFDLKEATF